jgi:hypothetical protein
MTKSPETNFLYDKGKLVGVNMSSCGYGEHEFGIKHTLKNLGCYYPEGDFSVIGVDRYKISKQPRIMKMIEIREGGRFFALTVQSMNSYMEWDNEKFADYLKQFVDNSEASSAWDESGFAVISKNKEAIKELKEAIENENAVVIFGSEENLFMSGVTIMIYDRISEKIAEKLFDTNKNYAESIAE